jgi:hypothetical protein
MIETALEYLTEPRHRQVLHCMLARNAGRVGDTTAAEYWLSLCSTHSDDLIMDSAYRFSHAWVSTIKGEFQNVIQVLGARIDDVPIADSEDDICAVLRANAHERLGQLPTAVEQLQQRMMLPNGAELVGGIIQVNPELGFCPTSYPQAQQQVQQMTGAAVHTKSGVNIAPIFIVGFGGSFVLVGAMMGLPQVVPANHAETVQIVSVVVFMLIIFATLGIVLGKGSRVKARLAKVGVQGRAQVVSATETGTRVNNKPLIAIQMLVQAPGLQPFTAIHKEVVSHVNMGRIQPGSQVAIVVDPKDRTQMVIDWTQP